jgi:branched-chain amino acid transport system substrate-binding protein
MKYISIFLFVFSPLTFGKEYNLYLDADYSVYKDSSLAIQRGIETALTYYEQENKELKFNLIKLDHRGNTRRSLVNLKKILKDPLAVAVFGGLHSPPLISNNKFINDNQVLTLVPWAAGGPITRSKTAENWIYRLSIDDSQAGGFIAHAAVTNSKCRKPFLVLEKTAWGKSNQKNMTNGLKKLKLKPHEVQLFGWGISKSSSAEIAVKIKKSAADCVFFVGNGKDAKTIFNSFGQQGFNLPIFSHWGITGGNNTEMAKIIFNNKLNVSIIQTKFTFLNKTLTSFQSKIQKIIFNKYGFKSSSEIRPMSGWVHGFDLTLIMLNAFSQIDSKGSIVELRQRLKLELENMKITTTGLIKNYKKPFTKYIKTRKNAHEALTKSDYILKKYDVNGNLY